MALAFSGLGPTVGTYAERLALASPQIGQLFYQTNTDEYLKYVTDVDGTVRWMQADHDYNRSIVINGGFDVWQRGNSFNMNTSPYYSADRWQIVRAGAVAGGTASRQPSGLNYFNYCARTQRDSGNALTNNMWTATSFESINVKRLVGKYLTLSFWARAGTNFSAASSLIYPYIVIGTGTDGSIGFGFTGSSYANTTSGQAITTSWARYSTTISAPLASTATQLGIQFLWSPTGTAGANDYVDITGVQLEPGTAPSDFEFREYGDELRRCQRYYFAQAVFGQGYLWSNQGGAWDHQHTYPFPCEMRIVPTLVSVTFTNIDNARDGGRNTSKTFAVQNVRANNTSFPYYNFNLGFGANAEI